ncbi:MAG: rRNA adenine N-6-methyltransferase family protein, partial [Bacteroidales bacterium]
MYVKPKKSFGQHFLKNDNICKQIAESLTGHMDYSTILEIGPGTAALTKHLLQLPYSLYCIEADNEAYDFMKLNHKELGD